MRRRSKADAEGAATELPRLSWPVRRDGQDLIVSVIPTREPESSTMRMIDMRPAQGDASVDDGPAAGLISSLSRAADAPGTVAIQGFTLSPPDGGTLTFTLAVSLADIPYPEASELPETDISKCRLPCGSALRIFKWPEPPRADARSADPDRPGAPIAMFGTTYLAQTDYGVLALAFATPHVDGAREFAVLFEAIANTCTIQPGPPADASAT